MQVTLDELKSRKNTISERLRKRELVHGDKMPENPIQAYNSGYEIGYLKGVIAVYESFLEDAKYRP